ncbi:MAG: 4-(cytidine 5'-diphospho)-2-C-methyl-D-erythritol kinase [candidate division WOR-3 bacterium]|jgi:4-diphosphocytidyl-2-C-methyl-D-erythritol kinase
MNSITLVSPAKINLGLWVGRKRPDGYHEIVTIMVPLEFGDRIVLEKTRRGIRVKTTGARANIPEKENLAYRAAELFFAVSGIQTGIEILIHKKIPIGAGLGGGSSNAATVLAGLNRLFSHPLKPQQLSTIARKIGSDIPFFLKGVPCVARGRGEKLRPLALPKLRVIIHYPGFGISTAWAYQELDQSRRKLTLPCISPKIIALKIRRKELAGLAEQVKNSFETVVFARYPQLAKVKHLLLQKGAFVAGLSGSGSTVYGLQYPTDPMAAGFHTGHLWIITHSRPSVVGS